MTQNSSSVGGKEPRANEQLGISVALLLLACAILVFAKLAFAYLNDKMVLINNHRLNVAVADTTEERAQGLSSRDKLTAKEGMLFVFTAPDLYCFWMKDMNFPIDIIWLDENKKVVSLKENATPESYPESFCPDTRAKYVLEVNVGKIKEWQISPGQQANF
jgi:uncharacterized membrane protein (UPF0127 family)